MSHPKDVDDTSPAAGTPAPPSAAAAVALLSGSLTALVDESRALRGDVASAEKARKRTNLLFGGLLALVLLFIGLMIALSIQNNELAHEVAKTNKTMADCTTPDGKCAQDSRKATGQAIGDILRGQAFLSECARLYPNEVGPEYDKKLEDCVNQRLADPSRNPRPGQLSPQPSPSTTGRRP